MPVLIDERAGRNEVRRLGLPLLSTLGLVLQARKIGLISAARPVLDDLLAADYHLSRRLYTQALADLGE